MLPRISDALTPWQNPECTGINRLPGRASLWPYADAQAALRGEAPRRLCLDGEWDFAYFSTPEAVPDTLMSMPQDASWERLPVPGLWTMHGYDRPHYTNWRLPFTPVHSPEVPRENPVGVYQTTFRLPRGWRQKRVVLHFAGIEAGCAMVWLNGQAVGMLKDSRLPSEFALSSHLRAGMNTLQVACIKWADTTYIEDQDHWRQYGINRSVFLYATEETFIEDFCIDGDFDYHSGGGTLRSELRLGGVGGPGWQFRLRVFSPQGREIQKAGGTVDIPWGLVAHSRPREPIAEITAQLAKVQAWSHETPALYQAAVELLDPSGQVVEASACHFGFRRVEIMDRELRLNGKMVYIKGVNRHDHHDQTGKVMDRETMIADLRAMKAHHINAIRCSHYPNLPLFYELCDQYGFLVIDEANIECHHTYARTAHDPRYALAFLDRAMRMVLRDRSHPSIISWSLGNESGYGPNHNAMVGWIRRVDPSRLLHCEGAICKANAAWDRGHEATDIIGPMYPGIDELVEWARTTDDQRPLIMCEYSHAMGNSNGSLADYWQAIRAHHGLQGGFIWEWIDHGLRRHTSEGEAYWAYGGDYGDSPHDADFVCDGLVWPDRQPHPALREVKRLFQPLQAELRKLRPRPRLRVRNDYDFIHCGHLRGTWELVIDGSMVEQGALPPLRLAPGEHADLDLPFTLPPRRHGEEAHVNVRWYDRRDQPLLGSGVEAAHIQLPLPQAKPATIKAPSPQRESALSVSPEAIYGAGVVWHRDSLGAPCGWEVAGRQLLTSGPTATIWRAPTENDGVRAWHYHTADDQPPEPREKPLRRWSRQGLDQLTHKAGKVKITRRRDGTLCLQQRLVIHGRDPQCQISEDRRWELHGDGRMVCEHRWLVPQALADLPRLGVVWQAGVGLDQLEWFGHGPEESYRDRLLGTPVGRYQQPVSERYVPYIMPQEHGNIAHLRWLALRAEQGQGLLLSAQETMEGKATLLSDETLSAARHTYDLRWEDQTLLYLDVAQRGLGTASCGPDTLPAYRLPAGRHRLRYTFYPLASADDPARRHRLLTP